MKLTQFARLWREDEGVQSVWDVADHLRAPCWVLLNLQLRSHLGHVSKLLFSFQGLLNKLQFWSVAGAAWASTGRIYPGLHPYGAADLGHGQSTTRQVSAEFPSPPPGRWFKFKP